ncbi:MAG: hypothetical protein ACI9TH_002416 [Kiritimatiellia bacterium]|jgi:hypothetical protein
MSFTGGEYSFEFSIASDEFRILLSERPYHELPETSLAYPLS